MEDRQIISCQAVSGQDRYRIQGNLHLCNNGISLTIFGGERPHIGSIVLATPVATGVTISVINVTGHRDEVVAREAATRIAEKLDKITAVTAGIHIEDAGKTEIDQLVTNTERLVGKLLEEMEDSK